MLSQKDKEIEILREYQRNNTNAMEVSHQLEAEIIQLKIAVGNISQEKVYLCAWLNICST